MTIIAFELSVEDFTKCPLPNGGAWGAPVADPEHTLCLPVGTPIRITVPAGTMGDIWAVPEQDGSDRGPKAAVFKNIVDLPDGMRHLDYIVYEEGKADIPLFHEAGNQHVRVHGFPSPRGRTTLGPLQGKIALHMYEAGMR